MFCAHHLASSQSGSLLEWVGLCGLPLLVLLFHLSYSLINNFGKVSGYSINWSKSEILPLTHIDWDAEIGDLPYKHTTQPIKYLGIHVSTNPNDIFKLNFTPLLYNIKEDLDRWNKLPLSLIGRISTVKMNILPKINYLLSMTPVNPPPGWFSSLNSAVSTFYWKGKRPRIKLTTLQKPKQYGGLDAPNFYHYFLSHQLQYIRHWTNNSNSCLARY